jgi:hypothetical protein
MMRARFALLLPCAALAAVLGCDATGEVQIAVSGNGRVRSDPAGIVCSDSGGDCNAQLGRSYSLSAEPYTGAHFDHWSGDSLCVSQNRPTIIVSIAPAHKLDCTAAFVDDDATTPPPTQ